MIEQFKIIEASAGTGKTFSLTTQLIRLLTSEVPANKILALTFTKKAAGEIRNRLYERLAAAALDSAKAEILSEEIGIQKHSKEFYLEILNKILVEDRRISISTIDGFFNQIAKLFTVELSLPHKWKIIDDNQLSSIKVEAIVKAVSTADQLQTNMLSLLQLLDQNQVEKKVINKILAVTKELFDRHFSQHLEFEVKNNVSEQAANQALVQYGKTGVPKTKKGEPDSRWLKAINVSKQNLLNKDWIAFLSNGLVSPIIEKRNTFYNIEIPLELREPLLVLIEFAQSNLLQNFRKKTLATRAILEILQNSYLELKHQRSVVTFSDIQNALLFNEFSHEELYARLDNKFDHILIDEFQDTSSAQWKVLEAFFDEQLLESSKSCFVVGDKKQAIYGWRGGKAQIFEDLKLKHSGAKTEHLSKSYRSSIAIIDNVNRIFKNLGSNSALEKYHEIAKKWQNDFIEHSTIKNQLGYVRYEFLEPEHDFHVITATLQNLIKKDLNIGILVRKNSEVDALIQGLANSNPPIHASMDGGTFLTKSNLVKVLLATINLIENPTDTKSFYLVCCSELCNKTVNLENAIEFSRQLQDELYKSGFSHLVQKLVNKLSEKANYSDRLRLKKIVEIAFQHDSSDYSLFCETIGQTKFSSPSEEKIKVMTIHQSKGLEFDVVILPFPSNSIDFNNNDILYIDDSKGSSKILPYPNKVIRRSSVEINSVFSELEKQRINENLSVLYVALTRAKSALYVYLNKTSSLSFSKILISEFFDQNSEDKVFELGSTSELDLS